MAGVTPADSQKVFKLKCPTPISDNQHSGASLLSGKVLQRQEMPWCQPKALATTPSKAFPGSLKGASSQARLPSLLLTLRQ